MEHDSIMEHDSSRESHSDFLSALMFKFQFLARHGERLAWGLGDEVDAYAVGIYPGKDRRTGKQR